MLPLRHPMYSMVAVIACVGAALTSALAQAPRLALAWLALAVVAGAIAKRQVGAYRRQQEGGASGSG